MLDFEFKIIHPVFDWTVIQREARKLADDIALHVQSQVKIALIRASAIATGGTLKTVDTVSIPDFDSRLQFMRQIVGSRVIQFIESGRRAGAKMPPEAAMIPWFQALGIPKRAWFPIRLSIARRGIKPRAIREVAIRASRSYIAGRSSNAGMKIAGGLLRR